MTTKTTTPLSRHSSQSEAGKQSRIRRTSKENSENSVSSVVNTKQEKVYRLNFIQRRAQWFAELCGLYVIPQAHVNAWDVQQFEAEPEGDIFEKNQIVGMFLTLNHVIMALNEYSFYQKGRPHNKIL